MRHLVTPALILAATGGLAGCGRREADASAELPPLRVPTPPATVVRPPARIASATRGEDLFFRHGCTDCHATDTDEYWGGPTMWKYWGAEIELDDGNTATVDVAHLTESLFDPDAKIMADASPGMSSYQGRLNADDIADLAAYLATLADAPTPGE